MNKKRIGSTLESLLEETGELAEVRRLTHKKMIADELAAVMRKEAVSVSEMSRRMGTSRAAVNRILDPEEPGLTLDSLERAASVLGRELRIHIARPSGRGWSARASVKTPSTARRTPKKRADKPPKRLQG